MINTKFTNTVMPALATLGKYLNNEAKKKVIEDFTTQIYTDIESTQTPEELNNIIKKHISDIGKENSFLSQQDKNSLIQNLNQQYKLKQENLVKSETEKNINDLTEISNKNHDGHYSVNGKVGTWEELLSASGINEITDPVTKYKAMQELEKNKLNVQESVSYLNGKFNLNQGYIDSNKQSYDSKEYDILKNDKGYYADKNANQEFDKGEELSVFANTEVGKYLHSDEVVKDRNIQREIERQKAYDFATKKQEDYRINKLIIGTPSNFVNTKGETVLGTRKAVRNRGETDEEFRKRIKEGKAAIQVFDANGNIVTVIKPPKEKTVKESPEVRKERDREIVNSFRVWSDKADKTFDTDLMNYVQDKYANLTKVLKEGRTYSDDTGQIRNLITNDIIKDLIREYNTYTNPKPEDTKFINALIKVLPNNIKINTPTDRIERPEDKINRHEKELKNELEKE